ncbi:MAG TPA: hypothetical protein VGH08_07805 [Chthoniobacterales bacterium]|jgi:hypothetical protein
MAEIPKQDRAAIKSDIALSRDRLARELSGVRYELDFPRKIKSSFRHQPAIWIGAVVLVGLIIAVAPARKKKVYVQANARKKKSGEGESILEAGALVAALKFAATLLRPVVVNFLTTKLRGGYGSRRAGPQH